MLIIEGIYTARSGDKAGYGGGSLVGMVLLTGV